jgi:hypothetical protein
VARSRCTNFRSAVHVSGKHYILIPSYFEGIPLNLYKFKTLTSKYSSIVSISGTLNVRVTTETSAKRCLEEVGRDINI